MTSKGKKVKVDGWAVISNGKIASVGQYYQPEITVESLAMARYMLSRGVYVIGEGYEPQIVPCTISYTLPSKPNKKK